MARSTKEAAEELFSAAWVLVLSKGMAYQGMLGPFSSADEARGWAAGALADEPAWIWRLEPLVSPASLPEVEPASHVPTHRPHLVVVR